MGDQIGITTEGSFKNLERWLITSSKKVPKNTLKSLGSEGVANLKSSTPRDTGITAEGWDYRIQKTHRGWDIVFFNRAHPGVSPIPLPLLIMYGHGTGTGGYVPPNDFINPALRSVYNSAGDRFAKELFK